VPFDDGTPLADVLEDRCFLKAGGNHSTREPRSQSDHPTHEPLSQPKHRAREPLSQPNHPNTSV